MKITIIIKSTFNEHFIENLHVLDKKARNSSFNKKYYNKNKFLTDKSKYVM